MGYMHRHRFVLFALLAPLWVGALHSSTSTAGEPLKSWNDSKVKRAIIAFVEAVSDENSPDFVPVRERIAVFDNDGTLWVEQPMYVQAAFVVGRVQALALSHAEWKDTEPFKSVLGKDLKGVAASGMDGVLKLVAATHAGMSTDEFDDSVKKWLSIAKHPKLNRPYLECIYQPQLELLEYLRAKGFKTYIVSGGGVDFMRPWTEEVYGVPPEQVVGSSISCKYELRDGQPTIVKQADIDFIDDKAGKPVGIHKYIGRRPIVAVGNSDGDYEMLDYVTSSEGPSLGLLLHHTDDVREYAYGSESPFGRLDKALTDAEMKGWKVVDMKRDWKVVFPIAKSPVTNGHYRLPNRYMFPKASKCRT